MTNNRTSKHKKRTSLSVPQESIQEKILLLRGQKVMLDKDLAILYGVETKVLNQAVKRNLDRFPDDFMFQMTKEELKNWRCQSGTSNKSSPSSRSQFVTLKRGYNIKYAPYAFTEQGIAMLSSVLNSKRAIQVNISIMRAFVKLRELMISHKDLAQKIHELERKHNQHDKDILVIFEALKRLMHSPEKPKNPIGFQVHLRKEKTE